MIDEHEREVIRTAYRQAKFPARQLRIEAELHGVPVEKIKEVVGLPTAKNVAEKEPYKGERSISKLPPDEHAAIVEEVLAGRRCYAVAVEHHVRPALLMEHLRSKYNYEPPEYRQKRSLTVEQVAEIKKAYAAGEQQKDIAKRYGCCAMVISKAVNGKYDKEEEA